MLEDAYDNTLSTGSTDAAAAYIRGVRRMLETRSAAELDLTAAIRHDPQLALAYAALAVVVAARDPAEAAALGARADELAATATRRERQHVHVIAGLATRRPGIVDHAAAHLAEFPRDALVLEHALRHLFFFGGPCRGEAALALVASCRTAYPGDDWYMPARHAFFLQELERYDEAEPLARVAVERNPHNGNAFHALAHVLHGRGRHDDARALLEDALAGYDGFFRSHFRWHIGIVELASGAADPLATFDADLAPGRSTGPAHLALADAVGFLTSCGLAGIDASSRWRVLHPLVERLAATPGQPFVDIHVAVALAALGDRAGLEALIAKLAAHDAESASWGRPIVEAIAARAANRLLSLDDTAREAFGGSQIEREIVDELVLVIDPRADLGARFARRAPIHPVLARLASAPR